LLRNSSRARTNAGKLLNFQKQRLVGDHLFQMGHDGLFQARAATIAE